VLSFGTAGCNLACRFCQNWDISKSPEVDTLADAASPTGRCSNRPLTPPATLRRARQIALANGLRYVYTGNVLDRETGSTWGHACGALLIERSGYDLGAWHLTADGRCAGCSQPCAGVFDVRPAHWGSRRVPVRMAIVR
jgi:pyruvate formate lyase activating enzyme